MADAFELAKALQEKARHKEVEVRVSKAFISNFNLVMAHYRCTQDEIKEMKETVRRDVTSAETCFAELAKELEYPSAIGINERIRGSLSNMRTETDKEQSPK